MKDNAKQTRLQDQKMSEEKPAFHVIILGAGGGPREDNATGLLVRSTEKQWAKGSVLAVDAGVHLSAIIRILEKGSLGELAQESESQSESDSDENDGSPPKEQPPAQYEEGFPFHGANLPWQTARANAVHFIRELISTYIITHPHLDHVSGFIVNTPAFQHTSRPKKLAALPGTINAIKAHIFNNIIWPNLSDEEGGVGLVSYMRLVEGGSLALGAGDGRGYVEVCEGLTVKCWSVSHGHKMTTNSHRNSNAGIDDSFDSQVMSMRRASLGGFDSNSLKSRQSFEEKSPVYDSSAFFIRDDATGKEILVFGDVEPDSISMSPRNSQIWSDAAPKIARGILKGIFIECSYDDSQPDEVLFGHLCPRHLIEELKTLGSKVLVAKEGGEDRFLSGQKRKRQSMGTSIAWDLDGLNRRAPKSSSRRSVATTPASHYDLSSPRQSHAAGASTEYDGPSFPMPSDAMDTASSPNPFNKSNGEASASASISQSTAAGSQTVEAPAPPTPTNARASHASTTTTTTSSLSLNQHHNHTHANSHAHAHYATGSPASTSRQSTFAGQHPLKGVKVVIIHVKDTLRDGKEVGHNIMDEMARYEVEAQLGCEFVLSEGGAQIWL